MLAVALLLILTLLAVYLLAGTDAGFTRVSKLLDQRVDAIQTSDLSGNLVSGVTAEQFQFNSKTLSIDAMGVQSAWTFKCLFKRRVCLDNLTIDRLDVLNLAPKDDTTQPQATGDFTLPEIALPLNISISNVRIRELHIQTAPDATETVLHDVHLSAETDGTRLRIEDFSLAYRQGDATVEAILNGTVDLVDDYDAALLLEITTDDLLPDSVAGGTGNQPLRISTRLSDTLTNLTVSSRLSGLIDASLTAVVHPLEKKLPLTATLISDAVGWPLPEPSQALATDLRMEIDGNLDDFRVSLQAQINGEQIPQSELDINGYANTQRLSLQDIAIKTLNGQAQGSLLLALGERMIWDTRWQLNDIDPSLYQPELSGSLDASFKAFGQLYQQQWSLNVDEALINGQIQQYPFVLDAMLSKHFNDSWFVKKLQLNNGANQIFAEGVIDDQWDLQARIDLPTPGILLPDVHGSLRSRLSIEGDLTEPDIVLSAESASFSYQGLDFEEISIEADINQLFVQDSSLKLDVGKAQSGANALRNTSVTLEGNRLAHNLEASLQGPQDTALQLNLAGSLQDDLNWNGTLNSVLLALPDHLVTLAQATGIEWQNQSRQLLVDAHCWQSEQSNLCLENKTTIGTQGQADLSLDQYSLQRLNSLLPADIQIAGNAAANATVDWGPEVPAGKRAVVTARIEQGQAQMRDAAGEPFEFDFSKLSTRATLDPNNIDAELSLISEKLGTAEIVVQLNPTNSQSPMLGTIELDDLKLDILETFLPEFDQVSGSISASGALSGRPTAPKFDGSVTLDDPVLRGELLPLPVTGGQVVAKFSGETLELDGKILSEAGFVNVEGSGSLKKAGWSTEARLFGEGLRIVTDPVQDSIVNPDINISANAKLINISGDIYIPAATIDVEELPEGAATVSSDVIIVEDEQAESVADSDIDSDKPDIGISVDLNVALGDKVDLSAYGLSARLEGDLDVLMRTPNPLQLGGEITVVDGIYKQYGQDLSASGQILFVGPVDNTRLAIDAVREITSEDRKAGLKIQGTAKNPQITLFTEPSDKSQDAILSYIVLGRDINEASDQDANLLAAAALALTVRGGRNVAGGIASALGVEDFALETKGTGDDTELLVSGRLNDRLLLRYGRGVFGAQNTLYLRYDLTQKLYLEAAQGAEQAVDLFYSFSF